MHKPLTIGYAGTLMAHQPGVGGKSAIKKMMEWFWTYSPDNLNHTTRSGYYILKALQVLKEKHGWTGKDVQLQLWGNIDPGNQQQALAFDVTDMVEITGFCSREETITKLEQCEVLFLPLESGKDGQNPLFIPGKIYEYLMVGKPILALAGKSDCGDIINGSGLGIVADPLNTDQVVEKLLYLREHQTKLSEIFKPNTAFIEQYDFRNVTQKLTAIFDEVLQD